MTARVLLVASPAGLDDRVRQASAHPVEELAGEDDLGRALAQGTDGIAVVGLGPGVRDPVGIAQRIGRTDAQLAVVVLVAVPDLAEVSRALQFAPFLGEDVTCRALDFLDAAATAVVTAAGRTLRRRRHRATMRAAAIQLRASPGPAGIAPTAQSLGTLLDQAPVGVLTTDGSGRIASVNRFAERLLDSSADGLVGRALTELFPVAERDRLSLMLVPTSPLLPNPTRRFRRERPDGRSQELDLTAARFESLAGERGTMLLLQEVTERAAAERERRRHALSVQEHIVRRLAAARAAAVDGDLDRVTGLVEEALERSQGLARELLAGGAAQTS